MHVTLFSLLVDVALVLLLCCLMLLFVIYLPGACALEWKPFLFIVNVCNRWVCRNVWTCAAVFLHFLLPSLPSINQSMI